MTPAQIEVCVMADAEAISAVEAQAEARRAVTDEAMAALLRGGVEPTHG